jgi:hypothetical protein
VSPIDAASAALQNVFEAGVAVEATLEPLDVDAFLAALTSRAEALRRLEAALADVENEAPPLRGLVEAVSAQDRALGRRAAQATEGLRSELIGLHVGRQTLSGYRPADSPLPRFADRRG